jgi:hypothetical protein
VNVSDGSNASFNNSDPVSAGFVASLAHPGGNVTGFALDTGGEILGKRFELLKETLPNLSRVGIQRSGWVAGEDNHFLAMHSTVSLSRVLALERGRQRGSHCRHCSRSQVTLTNCDLGKIKAELKKRAETKAKRMLLKEPKRKPKR